MEKLGETNSLQDISLHVVYGNDLQHLAEELADELFSTTASPFDNRLVVVPDMALKEFLFHSFVANPRLKMAAGLQVLPLSQAVMEILDSFSTLSNRKKIPSFLELSFAIEEKLHSAAMQKFSGLQNYLNADDRSKRDLRIATLSDELARLFARYGLYGQQFLPKWLLSQGWQQTLWLELFSVDSPWTYPIKALKMPQANKFEGRVTLFGFSYLSFAHLSFFSSISATVYQISPCALFWEDHASDKEQLFLKRTLQRNGVKESVQDEIGSYMKNNHPLLGNWGKLGREMLKSLNYFNLIETDVYRDPADDRLLGKLKTSLLTLEAPSELSSDDSIQLHSATSKLREVEILKDVIETLMHKHTNSGDPLMPRDVLVVCPEILAYAPYIQMVFGQSRFYFALTGMPISSISESLQGFLQLLQLPEDRYELSSLVKLFQCGAFVQKNGFALEDVNQLCKWFKQAQIRRGLTGQSNSWEDGLDRLLYGLGLIPDDDGYFDSWPIGSIPQSEIDLFDRFLKLFAELKQDLLSLSSERCPSEWFELLLHLADKYLMIEWEKEPFFLQLRSLKLSCKELQQKISYESLLRATQHIAQKASGEISTPHLQKITFTSLQAGSLVQSRVLWCLGMDESAFPRMESRSSLCEMTRLKSGDYFPNKTDEERALFLELFVKAQEYLIFSYTRIHSEDGKHQAPSLLIEELNQYLDGHSLNRGVMSFDHPAFPFDASYFSKDAKVKKWSQNDFLAAQSHYYPQEMKRPFFTSKQLEFTCDQEIIIDIRQLKKLARNPLQFYFNETLKMYLKHEEDEEETEFLISYLRKSILRKKALRSNLPQVMRRIRAEGQLPQGLFQEVAFKELEEELQGLLSELGEFGIAPDEIRSVRLSHSCLEEEKTDSLFPSLAIPLSDSKVAYITGTLEDISPKGLLFHGENNLKNLVKAWPLYLVYRCLFGSAPLLLTKKGESLDFNIDDPQAELAAYLEYYLMSKHTPSPLMPEWAESLVRGLPEDFTKAVLKDSNDPYFNYLKRRNGLFDPHAIFGLWNEKLRKVFNFVMNQH